MKSELLAPKLSLANQASKNSIKRLIYRELKADGYRFKRNVLIPPNLKDKDALRRAHNTSRMHRLHENKEWILENEDNVLDFFANGEDVNINELYPKLVLVDDPEKSALFRYASYLWSVPISNGYGRRLRYLVMDESNDKIIGIIGMTDPVIGLRVRDSWIGWDKQTKEKKLWHVMDLYAFGAVCPYNYLLGGKLVATLATSNQVRRDFEKKYTNGRSEISGRNYKSRKGGLALLTTTGAYGESSILDRLQSSDRKELWQFLGFTEGWGSFHLNNGIVTKMYEYLAANNQSILKRNRFGDGPNWKMRVIRECMELLDIDYQKYGKHGIKRGFYATPLAKNFKEFLTDKTDNLACYNHSVNNLFNFFRSRYLLPRAERNDEWKKFDNQSIRVSNQFD